MSSTRRTPEHRKSAKNLPGGEAAEAVPGEAAEAVPGEAAEAVPGEAVEAAAVEAADARPEAREIDDDALTTRRIPAALCGA
jgi:hypothetical protein